MINYFQGVLLAIAATVVLIYASTKTFYLQDQNLISEQSSTSSQWQSCMPDNNSYGTKSTPIEYAKMIEPELGVIPVVDCGAGVEIPIYIDGVRTIGNPGLHNCDNPSLQIGDCMSGSSLQRYQGKTAAGKSLPHVVWVSFCRHDGRDTENFDMPNSVQLIGYNSITGATAFFESGDNSPWTFTDQKTNRMLGTLPSTDEPEEFNVAYSTPQDTQCVECHQSDPFIHNPFIDAAKLTSHPSQTAVPMLTGANFPYYQLGGSDWDMRTIHIEGNSCLNCHRLGMKTVEEFLGDGWHPNDHMPPHAPGTQSEDFAELLACWNNGPENTPGCEWIIPKAHQCESQIVKHDYPFKAEFNKPNLDEQVDRREERKQLLEQRTYILER